MKIPVLRVFVRFEYAQQRYHTIPGTAFDRAPILFIHRVLDPTY